MRDKYLILPKASYFFFFAAGAVLYPFLTLYYQSLGLTGRQIGTLVAITPLITLFAAPLLGALADATGRHHLFLILAVAGGGVMVWFQGQATTFTSLLAIVVGYALLIAVVIPIIDSTVLALVSSRSQDYGQQRTWGAVGWGGAAAIIGYVMESRGLGIIFPSYVILLGCLLVVVFLLPVEQPSLREPFWRGLRHLLSSGRLVVFLAVAFIAGVALAVILNFLFIHLANLGASQRLMGFSLTATTLSEMPMWLLTDRLQARWGRRTMLLLALGATTIRLFGYVYMPVPWLVLPISLLHGPAFAIFWSAGIATMKELAPPGMTTTAQGLFSGIFVGLGSAAGNFLGGWLLDSMSTGQMFFWLGVACAAAFLFVAVTGRYWLRAA